MKKIQCRKIILSLSLLVAAGSLLFFAYSCSCDEKVYMGVMAGARTERDCAKIADMATSGELPELTYACKGDKVTICWGGNVKSNKIEPDILGIGIVGSSGTRQIVVTESITIKIIPQNSCASAKEFKVQVLTGETPIRWDARWVPSPNGEGKCDHLFFKIPDYFMSANIKVVKIEAKFNPTDATNSPCHFPPFLTGLNSQCIMLGCSGFTINKPFEAVSPTIPPPAVGDWTFDFIDAACKRECKQQAMLPFELTLLCPDN